MEYPFGRVRFNLGTSHQKPGQAFSSQFVFGRRVPLIEGAWGSACRVAASASVRWGLPAFAGGESWHAVGKGSESMVKGGGLPLFE